MKAKDDQHEQQGESRLLGAVTTLLLLLAFSALAADELRLFGEGADERHTLLLGDKLNWGVPVTGYPMSSAASYLDVSADPTSGGVQARWNGKGEAQLYLASEAAQDLSAYTNAALVVLLRIDAAPRKDVTLRMGCGYPCAANAEVKKLFRALPEGEWVRVSFDLQCFLNNGLNLAAVDTPLLLITKGKLGLTVADVRLVSDAGSTATINCR